MEREVRSEMLHQQVEAIALYPENRPATHPTTNKILDLFERVSTYSILQDDRVVEEFKDELTDTQKTILDYLGIPESDYWCSN